MFWLMSVTKPSLSLGYADTLTGILTIVYLQITVTRNKNTTELSRDKFKSNHFEIISRKSTLKIIKPLHLIFLCRRANEKSLTFIEPHSLAHHFSYPVQCSSLIWTTTLINTIHLQFKFLPNFEPKKKYEENNTNFKRYIQNKSMMKSNHATHIAQRTINSALLTIFMMKYLEIFTKFSGMRSIHYMTSATMLKNRIIVLNLFESCLCARRRHYTWMKMIKHNSIVWLVVLAAPWDRCKRNNVFSSKAKRAWPYGFNFFPSFSCSAASLRTMTYHIM